jgi:RND family efflux transporter MFP subunit
VPDRRSSLVPVLVSSLAATLGVSLGCGERAASSETAAAPPNVSVQVVRLETLRNTIGATGVVTPVAAADWTISSPETGRVAELPKAEGDAVKPGDVLVRFDFWNSADDVAARQADVASAASRAGAAKATLAKISSLYDRGFASRNELDAAKNAVAQAESDQARASQQLDMANAAVERGVIKARFAGVVAKRFHNEGDLVNGSPTDPVLRVFDPTHVQIAVRVTVPQLAQILPGQQATILSAANPAGEPASVVVRPAQTDPLATTAEIRLAFTNPSTIPMDSPVQVEILLDQRANVVALPPSAILKGDDNAMFVMIAGADGRAHRRDVRLGLKTPARVEIVAGVTPGDLVITKNLDQVSDGWPITFDRR